VGIVDDFSIYIIRIQFSRTLPLRGPWFGSPIKLTNKSLSKINPKK
jgi:hypothetical protein